MRVAAVVLLCAATVASCFAAAFALYGRFAQTNELRKQNAFVWHVVICDIEQSVLKDKKTSPEDKVSFIRFYDRLLVKDVHAAPCNLTSRR